VSPKWQIDLLFAPSPLWPKLPPSEAFWQRSAGACLFTSGRTAMGHYMPVSEQERSGGLLEKEDAVAADSESWCESGRAGQVHQGTEL
jgi:hypothetical protein